MIKLRARTVRGEFSGLFKIDSSIMINDNVNLTYCCFISSPSHTFIEPINVRIIHYFDRSTMNKLGCSRIKLLVLNVTGALYTILTICGIAILNLYFTCPDLCEDCYWPTVYSIVILAEIGVNLFLFHYYNKRNQIQYWTAKSAWFLGERGLEKKANNALNGTFIDDHFCNSVKQKLLKKHPATNYEIKNFTKYSICEDGTYVDLKSELHGTWSDNNNAETEENGGGQHTKYCHECKMITPRRCQHCPLCNICVLRKDHHCFLLGGCAGLANQRYFIVFLFWASIGAIYGTQFNLSYLNKHITPWFPFGWFFYLGPVALIRWLFGYELLSNAFLAVMFSISFASSFGAFGFFVSQMIYTLSGFTMYDYHQSKSKRIECDGDNRQERLALVFGRRWWLNFIFPQFWVSNRLTEKIAKNIFLNVSKDL